MVQLLKKCENTYGSSLTFQILRMLYMYITINTAVEYDLKK